MAKRVRVDVCHLSGRYDAEPDEWRDALDYLATEGQVIALTEARGVDAVAGWAAEHGWSLARPAGAECAILAEPGIELDRVAAPLLTPQRLASGKVVRATTARLKVPGRRRWWGSVAHLPSSVEGRGKIAAGRQAAVHGLSVAGWALHMAGKGGRTVRTFDANLNYRLAWVRRFARATWARPRHGWRGKLPEAGTFRGRLIDWSLVGRGLKSKPAQLLKKLRGFDHRPFKVTIYV